MPVLSGLKRLEWLDVTDAQLGPVQPTGAWRTALAGWKRRGVRVEL